MLRLFPRLYLSATLAALVPAARAAAEPPRGSAEQAAHSEEARLRARATGKDIVVLQRGSDWNRLGEMLTHEVWLKDEFARALGDRFILMTVDLPEQEGAPTLTGPFSPADGVLSARVKPVPVATPSRKIRPPLSPFSVPPVTPPAKRKFLSDGGEGGNGHRGGHTAATGADHPALPGGARPMSGLRMEWPAPRSPRSPSRQ